MIKDFQEILAATIDKLTFALLQSLKNEEIELEDAQEIANFILEEKQKIVDENTLLDFLNQLEARTDIFSEEIEFLRATIAQKKTESDLKAADEKKIEAIEKQLSDLATN
jgi:hypothetical protein